MRCLTLSLAVSLSVFPALAASKDKGPLTDDRIHDQVLMKLSSDQDVRGGGIDVEVHNGVVTLKGKIETEKRKERAEKLVKHMKGVTGVDNQLVISK
jgi:osmotically-inducible protein OsmY